MRAPSAAGTGEGLLPVPPHPTCTHTLRSPNLKRRAEAQRPAATRPGSTERRQQRPAGCRPGNKMDVSGVVCLLLHPLRHPPHTQPPLPWPCVCWSPSMSRGHELQTPNIRGVGGDTGTEPAVAEKQPLTPHLFVRSFPHRKGKLLASRPFPPQSQFLQLSLVCHSPVPSLFSPLAPRPPIHPSNENLFSWVPLPVIPSGHPSPSLIHLSLVAISPPTLSLCSSLDTAIPSCRLQSDLISFRPLLFQCLPPPHQRSTLNCSPTPPDSHLAPSRPLLSHGRFNQDRLLRPPAGRGSGKAGHKIPVSECFQKWSWKESPAGALEEPAGVLCSCGLWESRMKHLNTVDKNDFAEASAAMFPYCHTELT